MLLRSRREDSQSRSESSPFHVVHLLHAPFVTFSETLCSPEFSSFSYTASQSPKTSQSRIVLNSSKCRSALIYGYNAGYFYVSTTARLYSPLRRHARVDAFHKRATRRVHRKLILILFEQLLVVFGQALNLVDLLDARVGTVTRDLTSGMRKHSAEVLVFVLFGG
jgi:hypothetical protein